MRLDEAVAAIHAEFPQADAQERLALHTDDCIEVTSGGLSEPGAEEPALYASRELAVAAFRREALDVLRARCPRAAAFVDGPHLDKWQITKADSRNTHRVAADRFSVTARIGLVEPGKGTAMPTAMHQLEQAVEALTARVAALEAKPTDEAPAAPAKDEALAARVAELEAKVERMAATDRRHDRTLERIGEGVAMVAGLAAQPEGARPVDASGTGTSDSVGTATV